MRIQSREGLVIVTQISLANETNLDSLITSIKSILEGKSITESVKGPSILILDDIDSFFSSNSTVDILLISRQQAG